MSSNKYYNAMFIICMLIIMTNSQNCPSNCATCSSPQVCTNCMISYYINVNSTCSNCP